MRFRRIVVPLDGSTRAEAALPTAVALAAEDSVLVLVRAAEDSAILGSDPRIAKLEVVREATEYLDDVAARLERQGMRNKPETSVWYGPAAPAIVEAARLRQADLIVMSTHGRSGLGRLVMGSVAESVLRATATPILLLRSEGAPTEAPATSSATAPRELAR